MKIHPYFFSPQKRVFDCALAAVLLFFLSPLLILIGFCIFITAGWPVIFLQKRAGQNGKAFVFYKFRTMRPHAEKLRAKYEQFNEAPLPMFKIQNDPRFIGIGQFLSRSGLDELPQLWNILKGDMSFVGPRPLPVDEAIKLPASWRKWRERVRPGIFSAWAVSPDRHRSLSQWQKLEEKTVYFGSLSKDFKLLFVTVRAIISVVIE